EPEIGGPPSRSGLLPFVVNKVVPRSRLAGEGRGPLLAGRGEAVGQGVTLEPINPRKGFPFLGTFGDRVVHRAVALRLHEFLCPSLLNPIPLLDEELGPLEN